MLENGELDQIRGASGANLTSQGGISRGRAAGARRSQLQLLHGIPGLAGEQPDHRRQDPPTRLDPGTPLEEGSPNICNPPLIQNQTEREFTDKFRKADYEKTSKTRKPQYKINRQHECHIERCSKAYGSLGSLLQHQKIKHLEAYNQTRVEKKQVRTAEVDDLDS